jgi:hypothetical protein
LLAFASPTLSDVPIGESKDRSVRRFEFFHAGTSVASDACWAEPAL